MAKLKTKFDIWWHFYKGKHLGVENWATQSDWNRNILCQHLPHIKKGAWAP